MTDLPSTFIQTTHYRRFRELCDNSTSAKLFNLCHGKPGTGKTAAAVHYSKWHLIEPLLEKPPAMRRVTPELLGCHTALYTPDVRVTPTRLQSGMALLRNQFEDVIDQATCWYSAKKDAQPQKRLKLLIIDEADRLTIPCLELLRDIYDRGQISIILVGMVGIDKRLMRRGQLHSRINFAYETGPLSTAEMRLFITIKWAELRLPLEADDVVSSMIMQISKGNLRILTRIFAEMARLQRLNCLPMITPDFVETARQGLLLGSI